MFTKFLNNKQNYTKNFAFWVRSYIYMTMNISQSKMWKPGF